MSLVRYCFLGVLQKELDEYKQLWNTHTIRPVRQSKCPSGKPEAMYHLPHSTSLGPLKKSCITRAAESKCEDSLPRSLVLCKLGSNAG
ncbi:hypothetical protein ILYODFUR_024921 [Ilyodon furcidens]|uniref:Uncharacterized protein n=1 Tax=Ilyodon furcidens TaxID=33524 RepID=A0ABV0UL47_9TELE